MFTAGMLNDIFTIVCSSWWNRWLPLKSTKKFTTVKPLKCHTQWKSASIGATMREIWSFDNSFPMEKPFNYSPLKLTSWKVCG